MNPNRTIRILGAVAICLTLAAQATTESYSQGTASWYGETHRGRLMANGHPFNPDALTAASWFYPLGTKVRVTLRETAGPRRSVTVTVTDRGPARRLVREGRIIDLSQAAFERLADPDLGLIPITVRPVD